MNLRLIKRKGVSFSIGKIYKRITYRMQSTHSSSCDGCNFNRNSFNSCPSNDHNFNWTCMDDGRRGDSHYILETTFQKIRDELTGVML